MKKPFNIVVLVVTLLWICVPQQVVEKDTAHRNVQVWAAHAESGLVVFLTNVATRHDTRVDLSHVVPLPDPPCLEFGRRESQAERPRDFGSFISSHHLYTQTTASDL